MTFEVVEAVRKGVPALIGLWGPSNSGKTYSALQIARGLGGPKGKIVMIDTENGRALFYADLVGGWHHLDLQPPFLPDRYTAAMRAAEEAGADVIIVDSMSHVWSGEGGVIDMAESARTSDGRQMQGLAKWKAPKIAYQKMFNTLLRSRVHVIFCLRSKDLNIQRGRGKDAEIENAGLTPNCGKDFIFEMTLAFLLGPNHKPVPHSTADLKVAPNVPSFKLPEELLGKISPNEPLSGKTGAAIADWIAGGEAVDQELEDLKRTARDKATEGTIKMRDWWQHQSKADQNRLAPMLEDLRATAAEADRAEAERTRDENTEGDALDDPFPAPAKTDEPPVPSGDPLDDAFTGQAGTG